MGARKFVVTGVGMIGCCPVQRLQTNTTSNECNEDINYWSTKYNIRLKILLKKLKLELSDINYSYFDAYHAIYDLIQDPQNYSTYFLMTIVDHIHTDIIRLIIVGVIIRGLQKFYIL